jgi:GalNAc-alpha-(1->4)-GalNAc-alpha-(1->3)-diNAcBac-PP-undecaprenol alpha-1,4-N-acetyl-D-galactosaminyltransferase
MELKKSDVIVFFIFSLNGGGAAKILLRLADRYSRFATIKILTIDPIQETYEIPKGIEIITLDITGFSIRPKSVSYYLNIIFSLRSFLKLQTPKKIISFIHIANIITIISSFGLKVETIVCERSDLKKTRIGIWWKMFRPVAYYFSDKIIIQNKADQSVLPRVLKNKVFVAKNPLPDKLTNISNRENRIISVGRLHPVKRYSQLINLLEPVLKVYPGTEFWICGEGNLRGQLQAQIESKSLQNQVKLIGHKRNIEEIIAGSRAFLMSSESEGQPNAMIEALVQGIPSVCFGTSSCFQELASFFPNTFVIPEGHESLFAQTVDKLISNNENPGLSETEKMQLLEKWNNVAYLEWDSVVLK